MLLIIKYLIPVFPAGSVTFDVIDDPDIGPVALQVFSENDLYLVMLGEEDENDYDVRTFRIKIESEWFKF